jgi:serine/threonine-protein kinase
MTQASTSEILQPDLGRYRLIAELARGGMGNVYLAVAQGPAGFNKLLVVKELKPEFSEDDSYVAMFLEEARLAARLTHPNIVQTYEVGSDARRHFMTMEYLDGRSLYRVVRHLSGRGGLPLGAHLRVLCEALIGLHYAHELKGFAGEPLGIVHRDVSPLNVLVTFDGQTKVLDFGIAKAIDSSLETQAGVLKGRVAYMAPEQACGEKVDRRADVYSAGVMLWEAAAGRRLWPQMSDVEILSQTLREGPPRLRSVRADAPADLDEICARALARDPDARYPSAEALREDLEAHLSRRRDAVSMREVGALVGAAFKAERDRMNVVIDEALARVRAAPTSGAMSSYPGVVSSSGTHSVSRARALGGDLPSMSSILAATPSRMAQVDAPEISLAEPVSREGIDLRRLAIGGAAAVALLAAATLGFLLRRPPASPAAAPVVLTATNAGAREAPAPSSTPTPTSVELVVRASPSGAQIALDGQLLLGDPARARVPRDGARHRVGVWADGYEPKVEEVVFTSDLSMDISLDRKAAPARPSFAPRWTPGSTPGRTVRTAPEPSRAPSAETVSAPQSAPLPAVPSESPAAAGRATQRSIVTSNPYGAQ